MDKNIIEAEFVSCVGLCVNDWNYGKKDVLILHTNNMSLLNFLDHFTLNIHYISKDNTPSLPNVYVHSNAISIKDSTFDLIIDLDNQTMDFFNKLLKPNGILITNLANLQDNLESAKRQINNANFNIKMPFKVNDNYYLFLSNKIHPLADICLQKIDMIEDLQYYNAKMHEGAFALPNYLKNALKGVVKN